LHPRHSIFRSSIPAIFTIISLIIIIVVCFHDTASTQAAPQPAGAISARDSMTLRMVQLAQTGHIQEARDTLRQYLSKHPGDGTMLYNLACFDLALDDIDQALLDLEDAFRNGYTNFRHMDNDLSLKPIHEDDRYLALVELYESRFRETFQARALALDEGYPATGITLWPGTVTADAPQPTASVSLLYERDYLRVEVIVEDSGFLMDRPIWNGGTGLLINLIHPISPDDYESRRYFSYGVSHINGLPDPTAVLIARHGETIMRTAPDSVPDVERDGDRITLSLNLPWTAFSPYAPPLDPELGLNIFYLGAGPEETRPVLSLMPESRLSYSPNPWRRYVPLSFYESDRSQPVMRGRLYDRLVETESVDIQLVTWCREAGQGEIVLLILDGSGKPTSIPRQNEPHSFEAELNLLNFSVPIENLPPAGAFTLNVECRQPDGSDFQSSYPFSRLSAAWLDEMNERIYRIKGPESELLYYRIHDVTRNLDKRHPQDPATHHIDAFRHVENLISTSESIGTCLPDSGSFLGGFSGRDNTQRFCAMYLPDGWRQACGRQLLVVVPPEPGTETNLAVALGRRLADHPELIVVVPQSHGFTGLKPDQATRQTSLVITWGQDLLDAKSTYLAGLGFGSDAVLLAGLQAGKSVDAVLLAIDHLNLDPRSLNIQGSGTDSHAPAFTIVGDAEKQKVLTDVVAGFGVDVSGMQTDSGISADELVAAWVLGRLDK
jgi:hypothetical protein